MSQKGLSLASTAHPLEGWGADPVPKEQSLQGGSPCHPLDPGGGEVLFERKEARIIKGFVAESLILVFLGGLPEQPYYRGLANDYYISFFHFETLFLIQWTYKDWENQNT